MTDDQLEVRLRDALAARDPGTTVPVSLRERVARVPSSRAGVRAPVSVQAIKAAGAILATAAAVVVGILGVSSLRNLDPGAAALPSVASGAPNPTPDLHLAGFVLALPMWLVVAVFVSIACIVGVVLEPTSFSVPGLIARPPRGFGWIARSVPRRLAVISVVALALAAGYWGSNVDVLAVGSSSGPMATHFMGALPGYGGNRAVEFFRYGAGTTIGFDTTIRNDGLLPVTILGGDAARPWLELRIFDYASDKTIFSPDLQASFPFAPFELAPNEERQIVFVWHLAPNSPHCTADAPIPSPEPTSADDFSPPPNGGITSLDVVTLRYGVLGFERTGAIELDPIIALWSPGNTTCGFDSDWASPKPSVP